VDSGAFYCGVEEDVHCFPKAKANHIEPPEQLATA